MNIRHKCKWSTSFFISAKLFRLHLKVQWNIFIFQICICDTNNSCFFFFVIKMIQWIFSAFILFASKIPRDFSTNTISMGNNFDNCDFRLMFAVVAQNKNSKTSFSHYFLHYYVFPFAISFTTNCENVAIDTHTHKKWNVSYFALQNSHKLSLLLPVFFYWAFMQFFFSVQLHGNSANCGWCILPNNKYVKIPFTDRKLMLLNLIKTFNF